MWFGVYCKKADYPKRYDELRKALSNVVGGRRDQSDPWYRYLDDSPDFRHLNHNSLKLLMSEELRSRFAQSIAVPMMELWHQIKSGGLTEARPWL